ncbi:MAG: hypothetical protein IJ057_09940 [Bacteroidales bacterium]|nr:hypothetical protein [Bacteroidales bacterium]
MTVGGLVSRYLKSQDIVTKKSDLGLNFNVEGWNFLLWKDADDPMFFRLILPGVFDVSDEHFAKAIMACNNVNWNFKVVKAVLYEYEDGKEKGASVWLCYEQQLDTEPNMAELLPSAVHGLLAACDAFMKEMNEE